MTTPHLPRGFPGFYSWMTLVIANVISLTLGMVVTFTLADRQIESERAARVRAAASAAQTAELNRQATCALVAAQDEVYRETPPPSKTGQNAAKAWHDLSIQFHCQER